MALPDDDAFAHWARRLREGERAALDDLFRQAYPGLLAYARRTADTEAQAQDAVQEAFVRLWDLRARVEPGRNLRALLLTAVRHRLLNQMRDDARRRDLLGDAPRPASPDAPDALAEAGLLADRLRGWIAELPARRREAFELTRFEGLSYAETARVMGLTTKTVERHVGEALRHLRDRLGRVAPDLLAGPAGPTP